MKDYQFINTRGNIHVTEGVDELKNADELDEKIKNIWNQMRRLDSLKKRRTCRGDKRIFHYLNNALKGVEKEKVELHLLSCDYCLDVVLFNKKLDEEMVY